MQFQQQMLHKIFNKKLRTVAAKMRRHMKLEKYNLFEYLLIFKIQKSTITNQRENKKAVTEKKSRKRKAEPDLNEDKITQPTNKQPAVQKKISEKLEPTNATDITEAEKAKYY
jgi:hypothetical protein